jgi:hypothetical protein
MVRTRPVPDVESRPTVRPGQPPIGLFLDPESDELTYFASEEEAEAAIPDSAIATTLNSAGMWSDLDWDDMEATLDRIRHESAPSRPFDE